MKALKLFILAAFLMMAQAGYAQQAVDMGLSVKWASCNVGASSPAGYGGHYAWGEVVTKDDYSWRTMKYCTVQENFVYLFSKYVPSDKVQLWNGDGSPDNKTVLELSDDAARFQCKGAWRTPTDAEWAELIEECVWTWTKQDDNYGFAVTSKKNGNSIFLPVAGYMAGDNTWLNRRTHGFYWSSSLNQNNPLKARMIRFSSSGAPWIDSDDRYHGFSIRPVME